MKDYMSNQSLTATNKAYDIIKEREGLQLKKYMDENDGWTIGYGHLIKEGEEFPEELTEYQAYELLRKDVQVAEKCIKKHVIVALNQNQYDALVSFVFNVGCGSFRKSTMLRHIQKNDFYGSGHEFSRWIYDDGRVKNGLVIRRKKERDLFMTEV